MRAGWIGITALVILVVGSLMGVASLLLLPIVGAVAAVALLLWMLARRARDKPPIR